MEVVEGTIGQIARRSWPSDNDSSRTTLSGIEVGHRRLQRIVLTEPLSQALESGKFARVLIWRGLTQGLVTRPFIAAVEVDGKTYKAARVLPMALLRILLWMVLVVAIGSVSPVLGVFVAACIIGFYVKNYLDFLRFGHR
jgi:hypothetical protein